MRGAGAVVGLWGVLVALLLAAAPGVLAVGDLAAGRTVTYSTVYTACPGCGLGGPAAVDGDDATTWVGNSDPAGWMVVDLGASLDVASYRTVTTNCTFKLQSSPDAATWIDRVSLLGASSDLNTVNTGNANVTARYWRMQSLGACSVGYPAVRTIELYAPPPASAPPSAAPSAASSAAPSATPAPLTCSPSCAVELVTADRNRLDLLTYAVGFGVFVLSALLAGVLVTTGLRR